MLRWINRLINRFQALRHTRLEGKDSLFLFHAGVEFHLEPGSQIIVRNGQLRLGYPLPGATHYASFGSTRIELGKDAKWICEGPVAIAPGATIRVSENGTLRMEGNNLFAHNLTLLCAREISIGRGSHLSWNVTLIDDDEHRFTNANGQLIRKFYRPLRIGTQAALQMNVLVPSGVDIGDRAAVAAGTVLRQDVPAECTAYLDSKLRIKEGFLAAARPEAVQTEIAEKLV